MEKTVRDDLFPSLQCNGRNSDITTPDASGIVDSRFWQQPSMVTQQEAQVTGSEGPSSGCPPQDFAWFWASQLTCSLSDGSCVSGTARHLYVTHAHLRSGIQDLYNTITHPLSLRPTKDQDAMFSEFIDFDNECKDVLECSAGAIGNDFQDDAMTEPGPSAQLGFAISSSPSVSSFMSMPPGIATSFAPLRNVFGTDANATEPIVYEDVLNGPGASTKQAFPTKSSSASPSSISVQQPKATTPAEDVVGTVAGVIQLGPSVQPGSTVTSSSTSLKPAKSIHCAPVEADRGVGDCQNLRSHATPQQPSISAKGVSKSLTSNAVIQQTATMTQAAIHLHWVDDFSGPDSARDFLAHPDPALCQAFEIANDDVDVVKAGCKAFVQQLYGSLLSPGVECPPGFNLKTVAQEKFWQQQKTALRNVAKLLVTPEQQKTARAYCYLAVDAAVYVHEFGILAGLVAETQPRSTRVTSDRLGHADLFSKCSQRLQNMIAAVANFKLVALDLLSGKDMHRLAYDPNHYVGQKITYLLSNLARQEAAEVVQTNKPELGLKVGTKRKKPS